ncbi:hypothetical protein L6164_032773 [Bauhinia variegata]|uniref:Uncharacterized protein n=1 Tax=Bauhinia variegata TaxID=167791 RepID=A0ACB9KPM5_BAUVA|nr:hypothetical protein L6164_032773 [Bauhinia variegata]
MDVRRCFTVDASNPNEIWKSDNILANRLPVLAAQITFLLFATRLIYLFLKPLHQPRFVAEILTGFILSPNLVGTTNYYATLFPPSAILTVETIASIGVIYYVFLCGMEMNLDTVLRARKKATCIAIANIILPMMMGAGIFYLHQVTTASKSSSSSFADNTHKACLFWNLTISITSFPVLAHILANLKLLYTGLGRVALDAVMIADMYNWLLFLLLVPFAINGGKGVYSVLSTILFILICFCLIRPSLARLIDRKMEEDSWKPKHLVFVVMGAFVCAHITHTLGTHSIFGAFVYGLIIPHGRFADLLIETSDDFASGIIAPFFFVSCGIRINLGSLSLGNWAMPIVIVLLLCVLKVLSTLMATSFFGMSVKDGMGLGLLMNTKGVLALVILKIGFDKQILNPASYTIMASAILLMTIIVTPIINAVYKPRRRFAQYKLRTIQKLRVDAELRILACIHYTSQATGMINLLETCNATRVSPLHVFALHLVELTGRTTSILAAHMDQSTSHRGSQSLTKSKADFESITCSFKTFAEEHDAAKVEILSALSSYETIHEDIHNYAEEKCTALILLPFYKQTTTDGAMETDAAHRDIMLNVLHGAPCSVGIFVDQGLESLSKVNMHILTVFIGGPDDHEALAVAWRMARHPGVELSVVRILLLDDAAEVDTSTRDESQDLLSAITDCEKQKELDDDYVSSFRLKAVNNEDSITYFEKDAHNGDDISRILTDLDKNEYDLYIVGQGKGRNSLVLSKLLEWSDCPELGVVGDIVASTSCSSVLVVQQYGSGGVSFGTTTKHNNQINSSSDGSDTLVVKTE